MLDFLHLIFFIIIFYCLEAVSHSLEKKKKRKNTEKNPQKTPSNSKISISQFAMPPCQNIFYLASDTYWFLKQVFSFDYT